MTDHTQSSPARPSKFEDRYRALMENKRASFETLLRLPLRAIHLRQDGLGALCE